MTATPQSCQPDTSDGLTNIERVRMALAISDAGYSWELDQEYAEDLLSAYDAQTARIEELTKALRDVLDSGALSAMEGCTCETCAPIAHARALVPSLEDRK